MPRNRKRDRGGLAAQPGVQTSAPKVRSRRSRAAKPVVQEGEARSKGRLGSLLGHSVCSVVMALGHAKVTKEHAMEILKANKIKASPATVAQNIRIGTKGDSRMAKLTAEQLSELKASAPEPKATEGEMDCPAKAA